MQSDRLMKCLVLFLVLAFALAPATLLAAERTAVVQFAGTIPIRGVEAVGTVTLVHDDSTGRGTWAFDGTIAGDTASASGNLELESSDDGQIITLTATSVETWAMPFGEPTPPLVLTLRHSGGIVSMSYDGAGVDVFGIPFSMSPAPTVPLEGSFTLTDIGSGQDEQEEEQDQEQQELPNTGAGDDASSWRSFIAVGIGAFGAVMLLAAGVLSWMRRGPRFQTRL